MSIQAMAWVMGILRARGGSSVYQAIKSGKIQYSPRTRR